MHTKHTNPLWADCTIVQLYNFVSLSLAVRALTARLYTVNVAGTVSHPQTQQFSYSVMDVHLYVFEIAGKPFCSGGFKYSLNLFRF